MALPLQAGPTVIERREMLAAEVRGLMAKRRVSQTELATRLGMKQSSISRRVNGKQAFTTDEIEAICDILGEASHDLVARSQNLKMMNSGRPSLRLIEGKATGRSSSPRQLPLLHPVE